MKTENIVSVQNPKVKSWVKLKSKSGRDEQNRVLIEGQKIVEEALRSGQKIESIIFNQDEEIPVVWNQWLTPEISVYTVGTSIIDKLSETKHSQGFFAVIHKQEVDFKSFHTFRFVLIVDEVQDPGNLGTIIRSADASGVDAIFLGKGTVDLYNSKVVRSAMGSIFHLPIMEVDLNEEVSKLRTLGFKLVGTSPYGNRSYFDLNMKEKIALVVGNESKGLSDQRIEQMDEMVKIPFLGDAESLNVSMATTIFLFERVRQLLN